MRSLVALLVAALALAAVACGNDDGSTLSGSTDQTLNLTVSVKDGEGKEAKGTLKCEEGSAEGGGFLESSADEHCRAARGLEKLLTTQPPKDRVCTQVYGGPQTARITGTFGAQDVARSLARSDGCQIADWEQADALLAPSGIKAGAAGP